jgi:hypothetical protein
MPETMDERLMVALTYGRRHKAEYWRSQFRLHQHHPSFEVTSHASTRCLSFACSCSGDRLVFEVSIVDIKTMLPDARDALQRMLSNHHRKGNKAKKRLRFIARVRARALLFRYLTKDQKWSLRAERRFKVRGKDGNDYFISEAYGNNVVRLDPETAEPAYRFCVVFKTEEIPVYDLLLAQKLMLEGAPRDFLDIAVVLDLRTDQVWGTGAHIDNPDHEPRLVPGLVAGVRVVPGLFENPDYANLERQEFEASIGVSQTIGSLLLHDLVLTPEALYDGDTNQAFVLDHEHNVVEYPTVPVRVPKLAADVDQDECTLKLITGIPARVYRDLSEVVEHFRARDLYVFRVLAHPNDPTRYNPGIVVYDPRVPLGRTYFIAEQLFVGVVAHWYDGDGVGFCVHNLNGIAVFEPQENAA